MRDSDYCSCWQHVHQVTPVNHRDAEPSKRDFEAIGNPIFPAIRHPDQERDTFINGDFDFLSRHIVPLKSSQLRGTGEPFHASTLHASTLQRFT